MKISKIPNEGERKTIEANIAIASKLGLEAECEDDEVVSCYGRIFVNLESGERIAFGPANNESNALLAAKLCCNKFDLDVQIGWNVATDNHWCQMNRSGSLDLYINEIGDSFEEAICNAIRKN